MVEISHARVDFFPDGNYIVYEDRGQGTPAIVFVHGWSCDLSYWEAQSSAFAGRHRVVALDLAGHGASGRERATWTMTSFGEDVAAVVLALDLQRVVLVGHSMGGDAIVEAARMLPGRIQGLVWVDVYRVLGRHASSEDVERWLAPIRADFRPRVEEFVRSMFPPGSDPALVERVAEGMAGAPPEIAVPVARVARNFGREMPAALGRLDVPVASIQPDDPDADDASMARHGVAVERMAGVGHFPMLEAPDAFNAVLERLIARMASGDSGARPGPGPV